jgi:hypothetical protein
MPEKKTRGTFLKNRPPGPPEKLFIFGLGGLGFGFGDRPEVRPILREFKLTKYGIYG